MNMLITRGHVEIKASLNSFFRLAMDKWRPKFSVSIEREIYHQPSPCKLKNICVSKV